MVLGKRLVDQSEELIKQIQAAREKSTSITNKLENASFFKISSRIQIS